MALPKVGKRLEEKQWIEDSAWPSAGEVPWELKPQCARQTWHPQTLPAQARGWETEKLCHWIWRYSTPTPSENAALRTSLSCLFVAFSKYKYPGAWISSLEIFHREALSHKKCKRPSQDRTEVAQAPTQWFIPQHNGCLYHYDKLMANCPCCKVSMDPYSDVNQRTK